MGKPLVSVCMGTFNRAQFLRETLESVFAQTYSNFEVVIVDDASTDQTLAILGEYGDRIRLIRRDRNSGTADIPRYEAAQAAKGKYCAFLDSDDIWLPGKLESQVAFMEAHPEFAMAHCYVRMLDGVGTLGGIRHEGVIPESGMIGPALLRHCFICTSTVIVRREDWLAAQGLADITGFGTEWDFFLSIARKSPIGFQPDVLAHYRRSAAGISQKNWRRQPRDIVACLRIQGKRLWEGVVPESEYRRIIVESCLENAEFWRGRGEGGRSVWFCGVALRQTPWVPKVWVALAKGVVRRLVPRRG